jgi:hypothetical protein
MRHRNRVWKRVLREAMVLGLLCGLIGGLVAAAPAATPRPIDSLLLSKILWGMPSERVAQALKLERNQYTILHDPVEGAVTIFQVEGKQVNFPEFRLVFLNFRPDAGLFKVNGFSLGSLTETVAALKHRYGDPDEVKHTSLAQSYQWNFSETTLSVSNAQFEITLK